MVGPDRGGRVDQKRRKRGQGRSDCEVASTGQDPGVGCLVRFAICGNSCDIWWRKSERERVPLPPWFGGSTSTHQDQEIRIRRESESDHWAVTWSVTGTTGGLPRFSCTDNCLTICNVITELRFSHNLPPSPTPVCFIRLTSLINNYLLTQKLCTNIIF